MINYDIFYSKDQYIERASLGTVHRNNEFPSFFSGEKKQDMALSVWVSFLLEAMTSGSENISGLNLRIDFII